MDFGPDNYQDFFDKLQSNSEPRNLRKIFEDDDKPLQSESKNLRYEPQSSNKQPKQKQQHSAAQHPHKQHEGHQQQEQKHKNINHSAGPYSNHQDVMPDECWRTVVAKVAQGYNGNENVGRVGVALSRNSPGASKLVVYKSKTQLLSTLLLTKSAQSSSPRSGPSNVRLRESYMQFYDDGRCFWSLRFEQPIDEKVFTEELLKLGIPIDNMRTEQANNVNSNLPPVLPQPLPRQQISTSAAEPILASIGYDSASESIQSTENGIASHQPCSIKNALIPLATNSSAVSVTAEPQTNATGPPPATNLEVLLDEQRGLALLDKKMDTILHAIYRLASAGNLPLKEGKDSVSGDPQDKLDSILQAMSRLANNNSMNQVGDCVDTTRRTTDNEDELLEVEQKLLNLKKENRALMKSLSAKEQALVDLRASTCAIFEKLLSQNNELKQRNATLLSALSKQSNTTTATVTQATSTDDISSCTYASAHCINCERYLSMISELKSSKFASSYTSETMPKPAAGQLKPAVATSRE